MLMLQQIINSLLIFIGELDSKKPGVVLKANIKLGAFVTEITGKIGGSVFQRGKGSPKVRNNNYRKNTQANNTFTSPSMELTWSGCLAQMLNTTGQLMPDGSYIPSPKTVNAQQNIRVVSKAWSQLLPEDHAAWASAAKLKTVFGGKGQINMRTGYSLYLSTNIALLNSGFSPVAKPECHWEQIAIVIGDEIIFGGCWVCGGVATYCILGTDDDGSPVDTLTERFSFGGTNAALLFYASSPQSPGRTTKANMKIVAVIKKVNDYESFILRPIMHKFFGKNINASNITMQTAWVNQGGSLQPSLPRVQMMRAVRPTILYTERSNTFNWLTADTTFEMGSTPAGTPLIKTFLIYGFNQLPNSAYTVNFIQDGIIPKFGFLYGDPSNPLSLDTLTTDEYGNILPIPLQTTFNSGTTGTFTCVVQFTITASGETMAFTLSGTTT